MFHSHTLPPNQGRPYASRVLNAMATARTWDLPKDSQYDMQNSHAHICLSRTLCHHFPLNGWSQFLRPANKNRASLMTSLSQWWTPSMQNAPNAGLPHSLLSQANT